ncbi:DNA polymerase IV [Aliifodinibius salicampi]|uniref:DNA polymerase IV n=1 Tax=Fodinibius salicampi TaxID=1920655 RepID=A0ABT3PWU6_9BACT|nr:DNA polymerase IV [Fodinibius salicampi]MCW9712326.1 DNA polymerase IV [Fodinibius salicampi]
MSKEISIDTGTYDVNENVHKITDYRCVSADMQHTSIKERLYLHLDMNCFYAQVEQLSYDLYGMPIYIGGWYKGDKGIPRGIVATSSYEARAFGVKTGMSAYEAEQLCPYLIGLQAHYEKYKGVSREIEAVLNDFAMDVEKYSMDEYFLDLNFMKDKDRTEIKEYGEQLQEVLYRETGLVCSVGISYSKTYSKLASELHKPKGLTLVLNSQDAQDTLWPLELDEVWGIGRKRYHKLKGQNIHTIGEAINRGYPPFQDLFGPYFGKIMWEMVAGKDRAKVLTDQQLIPKQLNYMHTFSNWSDDFTHIKGEIMKGVGQLCYRMRGYNLRARQYFCYLRIQDSSNKGLSFRFNTEGFTNLDDYVFYECMKKAAPRIKGLLKGGHTLRGIGVGTVKHDHSGQQELFFREDNRKRRFCLVQDAINNHYGQQMIQKASVLDSVPGKTHFLDRS